MHFAWHNIMPVWRAGAQFCLAATMADSRRALLSLKRVWRPRPELNRGKRFCRPLRNHSATWPRGMPITAPHPAQQHGIAWLAARPARSAPSSEREMLPFDRPCRTSGALAPHAVGDQDPMIDFANARHVMVDGQVRPSDVTDLDLIAAMLEVPRERFVPPELASVAYLDRDLPVDDQRMLLK